MGFGGTVPGHDPGHDRSRPRSGCALEGDRSSCCGSVSRREPALIPGGPGGTIADDLIDFVARADGAVLVALVFLLVFAESAILLDLVVPGEVGLVVAASAGAHNDTPLVMIIGAAAVGGVLGDSFGFLIGRRFGADLVTRRRFARRLRPALRRARTYYEQRGGMSVAVARWIGALRAVVPVVAGSAGMTFRRFALWDIPSTIGWSVVLASVGYAWGDDIATVIDRIGVAVSVVAVGGIGAWLWWRHRHRRHASR